MCEVLTRHNTRFSSIKQAISYCGLCGDEKSSADKVMRMPISKQRNKHIQRVLIEAAKLAPSESHELALTHARELERGNRNRATLAVASKMVCYMLAVERRQQDFVPAEEFSRTIFAIDNGNSVSEETHFSLIKAAVKSGACTFLVP